MDHTIYFWWQIKDSVTLALTSERPEDLNPKRC